ncbi:MAG: hypothetical protein QOE66_1487 [Chloroflexota bacterium]|nr:hypothetical protein [Chloroflexota bacterium]
MINVECPWCAGSATIEVAHGDEFSCPECAIRVEIVGPAAGDLVALAA